MILAPWVERRRVADWSDPNSGPQGAFMLPGPEGMTLKVVASDARDWDEAGLPEPPWEHVSVSLAHRTPTWKEMEFVREAFFEDSEIVIQLSVPRAMHLNYHPYCLHLWRPIGVELPLPPSITVAPAATL